MGYSVDIETNTKQWQIKREVVRKIEIGGSVDIETNTKQRQIKRGVVRKREIGEGSISKQIQNKDR